MRFFYLSAIAGLLACGERAALEDERRVSAGGELSVDVALEEEDSLDDELEAVSVPPGDGSSDIATEDVDGSAELEVIETEEANADRSAPVAEP